MSVAPPNGHRVHPRRSRTLAATRGATTGYPLACLPDDISHTFFSEIRHGEFLEIMLNISAEFVKANIEA